mgnify:CR=1 FL=1
MMDPSLRERLLAWYEGMTDLRDDELAELEQRRASLTDKELDALDALLGREIEP